MNESQEIKPNYLQGTPGYLQNIGGTTNIASRCSRCNQPFEAMQTLEGNENGTWHSHCSPLNDTKEEEKE